MIFAHLFLKSAMSEQLIEYISTLIVNYSDHTEGVNVATSLAICIATFEKRISKLEQENAQLKEQLVDVENMIRYAPGGFEFKLGEARWNASFKEKVIESNDKND